MADSADKDLEKASGIYCSSEYFRIRERIERLNRGEVASFMFSLFLCLQCKLSVEKHKTMKRYATPRKLQQAEQA